MPKEPFYHKKKDLLIKFLSSYGLTLDLYPEQHAKVWATLARYPIKWKKNNLGYNSNFNGYDWYLRANQLKQEAGYTLFLDKKAVISFDQLPPGWIFLQ